MLRNVAVVVVNGFLPFEFGTICEVFGVDRADDGLPSYDFAVVAGEPAPLQTLSTRAPRSTARCSASSRSSGNSRGASGPAARRGGGFRRE